MVQDSSGLSCSVILEVVGYLGRGALFAVACHMHLQHLKGFGPKSPLGFFPFDLGKRGIVPLADL